MFQKFGFNLRQAIFNIKRSMMTIITLALAISMIAGLFYYFDAFEREALRSSSEFDTFTDINLVHSSSTQQINCTNTFLPTDDGVYSSISAADLEVQSTFKYQIISTLSSFSTYFYVDHPPELVALGLEWREYFRFHSYQFDHNFYDSARFSQFFQIIEGRTPENENEIMIDLMVAAKLNYEVGSTVNLSTHYLKGHEGIYPMEIPNMTISGTFIPTTSLESYRVLNSTTYFKNYYYGFTNEQMANLEYEDLYEQSSLGSFTPILGYSNFEDDNHPFQKYYRNLVNATGGELHYLYYISGYGVALNREFTSFFNIYPPDRTVKLGIDNLIRTMPSSIRIIDLISAPLEILFERANRMRIISQIINIPILIVALIVGSFASKSATQNKVDEFLLLRSKGVSRQTVRNQIFMESIANGIVASILGVGLGFLTFYGHDIWIRPLIYTQFNVQELSLFVKQSSILLSLLIGIALSFFTSLSSVRYVNKLKTSELLTAIEQKDMEIEFDEQTVFPSKDNSNKMDNKSKRELKKEYIDLIEEKRKKTKKWSILYASIGMLALIYYLFIKYSPLIISASWPLDMQDYLTNFNVYGYLSLIFVITPIFLSIGLIRILTKEAPVLLGRFSRFIGRIFLKDKSYLLGLQMMKKKQYATVIMFLGIFSGLFVHLNVMSYSIYGEKYAYQNFNTGADLNLDFGIGTNITNTGNFNELTTYLKTIKVHGESLVKDAMVVYRHRHLLRYYLHYVNFSSYLNYVVEDNKILPDNKFIPTIMNLIDYNLNDPERDIYPGAIVNQKYLENNNAKVGDIVILPYQYYDTNYPIIPEYRQSYYFQVRILGVMEYMPGVYTRPLNPDDTSATVENIVVDVRDLPLQGDIILHATNNHLLINLNDDVESDKETVQDIIKSNTEKYFRGISTGDYKFYIDKWLTIQDYDGTKTITPLLVYKMAYLIFIVVLIQVALGLPILLSAVRRKEQHFYGILLSRGFGKKGIFRFIIAEIFVIYFIAIIGGIAVGLLSSTLSLLVGHFTNPYAIGQEFRLFINPLDLLTILGSVIGVSFVILLIGFLSTTRRSISEYLTKF